MKKVKAMRKVNGETVYNFNSDAANSDPIRTARLMDAVNKGDQVAIDQLKELELTPMYWDGEK